MSHADIIRAWKDEDYRLSLSDTQRALLPNSPVGLVELSSAELGAADGGMTPTTGTTITDTVTITLTISWLLWC